MYRLLTRLAGALLLAGIFMITLPTVRAAAALSVASDISYAPLEFYDAHKQMMGFDIDLARALGSKLGQDVNINNHNFDDIIPAIQKGTITLGISSMSDTRDREKKVDFIDYMLAGSGMLVASGNPHHVFTLGGLCGLSVDVQKGTSQETALNAQSEKCKAIGLGPINILTSPTDDGAFKIFEDGKSDVHVTDYPVVAYLARTTGGGTKYVVAGRQFATVPYGIAVSKSDPDLRAKVQHALEGVIADGTYDSLLKKWGLAQGAMRSAPVNAGTLYEK